MNAVPKIIIAVVWVIIIGPMLYLLFLVGLFVWEYIEDDPSWELHAYNRCKDYAEEATSDGIKFKYGVDWDDNRAPEGSGRFLYVWEGEYEAYLTKLKRYARVECKGTLEPLYVEFLSIDGVEIERAD